MRKFKVYQVWEDSQQGESESVTGWLFTHNDEPVPCDETFGDFLVEVTERDKNDNPISGVVEVDNEEIIKEASIHYGKFLSSLGFDYKSEPHMKDTPLRVAKAWVNDLSSSLFNEPPLITSFENDGQYPGIVVERNIPVTSMCAHHNLPFVGTAHVAYIPNKKVIGLSKLNRIVDYLSRKPTVQETLTKEIHDFIDNVCEKNRGVAVIINSSHMCVSCRGIRHNSDMVTSVLTGEFYDDPKTREEFFMLVGLKG